MAQLASPMLGGFLPRTIQARNRALQPQAIVVVEKSFANTVTVTGEVVAGAEMPLSPGGNRLLEVIAAAGGAKAPVNRDNCFKR
jgi:protein involved in polysaccharide export with SLBB domain